MPNVENVSPMPGPVHCYQGSTSRVRIRQMSRLSWVVFYSRTQVLYSTVVEEEKDTEEPKDAERGGRMETPPHLFVYADFEGMQNVEGIFVANLLCPSSAKEEAIHVCWRVRIVPYNFFLIWMIWSMCLTVMKNARSLWCFTTWKDSMACSSSTNSTSNNERGWTNWRWAPKYCLSRADPSNSLTRFAFYPCRWHLFHPRSTWRN